MKGTSRLLEFMDIYAENIKFSLDGKYKFKSSFGGGLTIVTVVLVTIFSWLIGKDIYYKEKPFYYEQSVSLPEFQKIQLNSTNFPIAFVLSDINANNPDYSKYYNLKINHKTHRINEQGIFELAEVNELKSKQCEKSDFPSINEKDFNKLGLYVPMYSRFQRNCSRLLVRELFILFVS
jgi:hypothetical protein